MKQRRRIAETQPQPRTPGLTRKMVRAHAGRLFRDSFPAQPLTQTQWLQAETDLARKLENSGL